jgi:hypothetical protein
VGEGPLKDIIYLSFSRFKFQPSKLEGEKRWGKWKRTQNEETTLGSIMTRGPPITRFLFERNT